MPVFATSCIAIHAVVDLVSGQIGVLSGDVLIRSVPRLPINSANAVGERSVWVQPTAIRRCSAPSWMVLTL